MNDGFEKEVLQHIAERLLLKKIEIVLMLKDRTDDPNRAANEILSSLLRQGMIALTPAGDSTYAVTQKGMRETAKV